MRRVLVLSPVVGLLALWPMMAAAQCARFTQCLVDNHYVNMRYPRQDLDWNIDLIPGGAHVTFVSDDAKRMLEQALRQYWSLDAAIPWDRVDIGQPGTYAQTVKWVPQSDISGDPDNNEGFAFAICESAESTDPNAPCWLVNNRIRIAVDPSDGTDTACWMIDSWAGEYCDPLGCGTRLLDFLGVVTHEVGHSFGLSHGNDSWGTMYWTIPFCDTTKRRLTRCEQDSLVRRYHNNPASSLRGFAAYRTVGGTEAVWTLESGELNTMQYRLTYAPDWFSSAEEVLTVPATGAQVYTAQVSGPTSGILRIYEEETDGTVLFLSAEAISDRPLPVEPPIFQPGNIDSLCQALTNRPELSAPMVVGPVKQNRIFARDSLMAPARWWAQYKRDYLGINSVALNVDSIGGPTQIKAKILQQLPTGGTVTFLGSAGEDYSITGEPMRADPSKYTGGRTKDTYPDQPGRDLIRTFFILDQAPASTSVSDALPWITTDNYFVDFVGNHLVTSGYGIGRLPASNLSEAWSLVFKMAGEWTTSPWGYVYRLVYAMDYRWNQGKVAAALADSLEELSWPNFVSQYRAEHSPANPMTGAQRDAAFTQVFNTGGLWVDFIGTLSGGYNWCDFGRVYNGYSIKNSILPNSGHLPVVMGLSCYVNNHPGTENPLWGPRPGKQLLLLTNAGARAVIGPTSGTLQSSDQSMGLHWYRNWLAHPDWGLGHLLQQTAADAMASDPRDSLVIYSFGLLGDPDMTVPAPAPPVVGVGTDSSTIGFGVYPNPIRATAVISWSLPEKARVSLAVYDLSGRRLASLIDNELSPGPHQVRWVADGLPTGMYFLRLQAGAISRTEKVLRLN